MGQIRFLRRSGRGSFAQNQKPRQATEGGQIVVLGEPDHDSGVNGHAALQRLQRLLEAEAAGGSAYGGELAEAVEREWINWRLTKSDKLTYGDLDARFLEPLE